MERERERERGYVLMDERETSYVRERLATSYEREKERGRETSYVLMDERERLAMRENERERERLVVF